MSKNTIINITIIHVKTQCELDRAVVNVCTPICIRPTATVMREFLNALSWLSKEKYNSKLLWCVSKHLMITYLPTFRETVPGLANFNWDEPGQTPHLSNSVPHDLYNYLSIYVSYVIL